MKNWLTFQGFKEEAALFSSKLKLAAIFKLILSSVHEQVVLYKSCNMISSKSRQYSPHPACSQRVVSDPLRDEITSIASLQLFIYSFDTYCVNFSLFTTNINFCMDSDHSE